MYDRFLNSTGIFSVRFTPQHLPAITSHLHIHTPTHPLPALSPANSWVGIHKTLDCVCVAPMTYSIAAPSFIGIGTAP